MEIKDLAGLSEPMTKLIDVVAQGIGGWVKPWQIKRIADAKAYEIETVARALRKNSDALNLLEYDGEKVKMLCEQSGVVPEAAQELIALNERAVSRLTHRELRRQANIEKAVHYAMDELFQEENVSAEPVDEDWIVRFFNIVEDVSNEQMQQLWGRILAGEIKRPKSYSLRTLEALKNISAEEAEVFCKVGAYSLFSENRDFFICNINEGKYYINSEDEVYGLDIKILREIGLLSNCNDDYINIFSVYVNYSNNKKFNIGLNGTRIDHFIPEIELEMDKNERFLFMNVINFTKIGNELIRLIPIKTDEIWMDRIVKMIKTSKMKYRK